MTGGRCPWLGLLLLLTSTVTPAATTPREALEAIDACAQQLNPDSDTGYDRIVVRCPNLAHRLNESGLSVWLPREWQRSRNDLSAGGLRELARLLEHELTPNQQQSAPAVERVPAVLASLERNDPERSGWWARTRTWLRTLFETPATGSDEGWLNRMIGPSGLSQTVIELVSYVALMFVVLLAIAIVANELRVSRVWGRLRRRLAILSDAPADALPRMLSWEDVQSAARPQQAGLLLELLAAHLLEAPRGLTVRELARTAQLAREEDRGLLTMLAETAERVRFSNTPVSDEALGRALEGGRLLLERIRAGAQAGVS
jgi:Domain of unknown function (DUF4129)